MSLFLLSPEVAGLPWPQTRKTTVEAINRAEKRECLVISLSQTMSRLVSLARSPTCPLKIHWVSQRSQGGQSGISFNREMSSFSPTPLERDPQSHSCILAQTPAPPSYIPCAAKLSTRICRDLRERFGLTLRSPRKRQKRQYVCREHTISLSPQPTRE